MQYRIKSIRQFFYAGKSKYKVQAKYKWLPFWVSITTSFMYKAQAQEHIELKLKVYAKKENKCTK